MAGRYRRPTTPAERARADEARSAKLEALHEWLADEVAALRTGDDWQRWLKTAARFHNYSFGNTLLILAQRPDATAVAGYEAWKTLGRQVDKGQKGIAILAPVVRRRTEGSTEAPAAEVPAEEESSTRRVTGFRIAYVWDVAQTSGRPLPEQPEPQLLQGQAPEGLWDALAVAVSSSGYTVERGPCGGANGVTIPEQHLVRVRHDVDDAQAVKTLAHEFGHVLLHAGSPDDEHPRELLCRGVVEVEAESVAYLVTAVYGLDSGGYTFPYVAHWAGGVAGRTAEDVVRATGERVLGAARRVLASTMHLPSEEAVALEALADRVSTATASTAALRARAGEHARQVKNSGPERDGGTAATRGATGRARPTDDVSRVEILDAHRLAAAFYVGRAGESWVPDYLAGRSLSAALEAPWSAGYAPAAWHELTDHLRDAGLDDAVLVVSGLATPNRNGRLIDRFRDRLMLPVREAGGPVVGFVGRAHPDADPDRVPRYVNSPQTPVYRKSELVYGLCEARDALAAGARPVLVEGPLDAIAVSSGTAGRCVGLASCGTALTEQHVTAIAGTVDLRSRGIVVAMDADEAGYASARCALDLLSRRQVSPTAAALPGNADPAFLLHEQGPAALTAALLDHARPLADIVVDAELTAASDCLQWMQGRLLTARELAPLLASLPIEDIGRQAQRVADRLDLSVGVVQREIVPFIGIEDRNRRDIQGPAGDAAHRPAVRVDRARPPAHPPRSNHTAESRRAR